MKHHAALQGRLSLSLLRAAEGPLQNLSLVFAFIINVLMLVGFGVADNATPDATRNQLLRDVQIDYAPLGYYPVYVIIRYASPASPVPIHSQSSLLRYHAASLFVILQRLA